MQQAITIPWRIDYSDVKALHRFGEKVNVGHNML
jgi:hypothetical protein